MVILVIMRTVALSNDTGERCAQEAASYALSVLWPCFSPTLVPRVRPFLTRLWSPIPWTSEDTRVHGQCEVVYTAFGRLEQ